MGERSVKSAIGAIGIGNVAKAMGFMRRKSAIWAANSCWRGCCRGILIGWVESRQIPSSGVLMFHHRNETIISYLSYFFTPFVILAGLRFHYCGKPPQSGEKEEEPYPLVL